MQLTDRSIIAFATHCRQLLEIDLHECKQIEDDAVTALISEGPQLRELRLAHCVRITDNAFLNLPGDMTFESLRILDLTDCGELGDYGVQKIVTAAPRLRNLVLAKCRQISDRAVMAITKLGKNLHYIHLGHCAKITDAGVQQLVRHCNRIRYIDLACCTNLTDASVTQLATLPKLKRIGLVKCGHITDQSIYALAKSKQGNLGGPKVPSSLERVHLSYCITLSLKGITALLNNCPRLTHLSLTGVAAFLQDELLAFCREAPPEFNDHQRELFCVFSGPGVSRLRNHLNQEARNQPYDTEGTIFDEANFDDNVSDIGGMNMDLMDQSHTLHQPIPLHGPYPPPPPPSIQPHDSPQHVGQQHSPPALEPLQIQTQNIHGHHVGSPDGSPTHFDPTTNDAPLTLEDAEDLEMLGEYNGME